LAQKFDQYYLDHMFIAAEAAKVVVIVAKVVVVTTCFA